MGPSGNPIATRSMSWYNLLLYKNMPWVAMLNSCVKCSFLIGGAQVLSEYIFCVIMSIVSRRGTLVNNNVTSKLTWWCFRLKLNCCSLSIKLLNKSIMYVPGIKGFVMESRNLARLYSGVPIIDTRGCAWLSFFCTFTAPYSFSGTEP